MAFACRHLVFSQALTDLEADIVRYLTKSPENVAAGDNLKTRLSALLTPQLQCLVLYRVSHWLRINGWFRMARALSMANFYLYKVMLPAASCIGSGCFLPHPAGATFCGRAGDRLTLYSLAFCGPEFVSYGELPEASPLLGNSVLLGAHTAVLGPVYIGDSVKVGFHSRVTARVPAGSILLSRVALTRRLTPQGGDV